MALTYTIIGRPATKKNSMRIGYTVGGRPILLPSKANVSWSNDAVRQLVEQHCGPNGQLPAIDGPVSIHYRIYLRDRQSEGDVDNYMAAINDVLQKARVIVNDKQIRCGMFTKSYDKNNARVEVVITAVKAEAA